MDFLFCSILGCVLPLQEVAFRQSPLQLSLSFVILVYTAPCCPTMSCLQRRFGPPTDITPFIYHSVLLNSPSIIFHTGDVSSPFPFRVGYVLDYVCHSGLCLKILSVNFTFSICLSMARWVVSSFFTNAFVRDHVWHPCVIAGKTHWLATFLFRLMGRCLSRKISLYFPKNSPSCFYSDRNFLFVLFSIVIVCPRYL